MIFLFNVVVGGLFLNKNCRNLVDGQKTMWFKIKPWGKRKISFDETAVEKFLMTKIFDFFCYLEGGRVKYYHRYLISWDIFLNIIYQPTLEGGIKNRKKV